MPEMPTFGERQESPIQMLEVYSLFHIRYKQDETPAKLQRRRRSSSKGEVPPLPGNDPSKWIPPAHLNIPSQSD
jgi:hypothetical protein